MPEVSPTLIVPWFGGARNNLQNTVDSVRGLCNEVTIVHQVMFDDDAKIAQTFGRVVPLDWNTVIIEGYACLPNYGADNSHGDWMLLLGVGETVAEQYLPFRKTLEQCTDKRTIFRCDHHNDVNKWGRVWNPSSGVRWGGLIHEEVHGNQGPVLFRMQDTDKAPLEDHYRNDVLKWFKSCSYHLNYHRLLNNPDQLSHTNKGWLDFVRGSRESIEEFMEKNRGMVDCCLSGDRQGFIEHCAEKTRQTEKTFGVNFNKLGEPMSS